MAREGPEMAKVRSKERKVNHTSKCSWQAKIRDLRWFYVDFVRILLSLCNLSIVNTCTR